MKKIIKLNEAQLFNLIDKKTILMEQEYPRYMEHWENKFEKGKFNVPQPAKYYEEKFDTIDIIFIPLLIFDKNGHWFCII